MIFFSAIQDFEFEPFKPLVASRVFYLINWKCSRWNLKTAPRSPLLCLWYRKSPGLFPLQCFLVWYRNGRCDCPFSCFSFNPHFLISFKEPHFDFWYKYVRDMFLEVSFSAEICLVLLEAVYFFLFLSQGDRPFACFMCFCVGFAF